MKSILIIEDEMAYQKILKEAFEKELFNVILASEGHSATNYINKALPDLILLDIILPGGMNGFDFLEQIRANKNTKNIPVVIITNIATEDVVVTGWADVYSSNATDQPLQIVIETTNNCTGTTVGNANVTYTLTSGASAVNDRGSIKISGIALNPGTSAQNYSLCAAVTSGAGDSDFLNWGLDALVIDTGS